MTKNQMIEVMALFGELPRSVLHMLATSLSGLDEDRLLEIQDLHRTVRYQVARSQTVVPDLPKAITKAAQDIYQTDDLRIDDVQFPYDVAEGEGGTWVAAWVWVPIDDIQAALPKTLLETDHVRYDRNSGGD